MKGKAGALRGEGGWVRTEEVAREGLRRRDRVAAGLREVMCKQFPGPRQEGPEVVTEEGVLVGASLTLPVSTG